MSLSIFGEKTIVPNEKMLSEALGSRKVLWDNIKKQLIAIDDNILEEWKFYSKAAGWTLVVKGGKQTLLYLIPLNGYFKINFVFGEKAVALAKSSDLPQEIIALILDAKPYMEDRSFMIDVHTDTDGEIVNKLLKIKIQK
ncbi:DUF3788 family protein [Anaerorhabdus sp.]|uniref:DUF3788 family protein n=1 Tax=Anaerorhabdus sp. TaxID=1872524 RepID=UPI002FC9ED3E